MDDKDRELASAEHARDMAEDELARVRSLWNESTRYYECRLNPLEARLARLEALARESERFLAMLEPDMWPSALWNGMQDHLAALRDALGVE